MTEEGLNKIKDFLDKGEIKKESKILGIKIADTKKVLVNYFNQIIEKKGGKRQLEAAYRHCANIVMHHEGLTDKEINDFWWSKSKSNEKDKKTIRKGN